jgi:BirA family biotin operon repressor/biotin-[acetyl-CoA-carboxylase] ligase
MHENSKPEQFLALLKTDSYISGQHLAKEVGRSRSAVWKNIMRLRRHGYSIESLYGIGYRLAGQTDSPVPWEVAKVLRTSFVGKKMIYKESVYSTQSIAISLASKQDSHGVVIIAEQQKSGRGRLKRKWLSPKGGLWLSVILKPSISTARMTVFPHVAALAVCDSIRETTKLDARLKWPNDVLISDKKVAGILLDISTEAKQINYVVIGIGINANVDTSLISSHLGSSSLQVTSIKDEIGHNVSKLELTRLLLEKLERYYLELEGEGPTAILQKWKQSSDMLGRQIIVSEGFKTIQGTAKNINDDGSLVLKTDDGEVCITSGDIRVRY